MASDDVVDDERTLGKKYHKGCVGPEAGGRNILLAHESEHSVKIFVGYQ